MDNPLISRRRWLRGAAAAAGAMALPALLHSRASFAAAVAGEARLVLVLLRGALDGLAAAPPVGDPDHARLRGELALSGADLPRLDDLFALHPSLRFMAGQWQQRHLTLLHAVATPYRERSHFDGQDVLETGHARPHASASGWLNRALAGLPGRDTIAPPRQQGVALGAAVPLIMRGPAQVASWSPSVLPGIERDTLQRLADLYAGDALLARRLAEADAAQQLAEDESMDGAAARRNRAQLGQVARMAAGFLRSEDGPRVAVLESSGWDTHAGQGGAQGALATRLAVLDAGLATLQAELGEAWSSTAVLVVTEFGRTAAINGTRGTDHGTGAAAFLLGGAVQGGRVIADWPGLATRALHEGRDLAPTLDLRAVFAALLTDHLGIDRRFVEREVFPDAGPLARLDGLVRAATR